MKQIFCWKVTQTRGMKEYFVTRFTNEQEAKKFCTHGDGALHMHSEDITIYESMVEYQPTLDTQKRVSGLAKLSPEEILALGLDSC